MGADQLTTQIFLVLAAVAILWIFLKTLKIVWKIFLIVALFLALSFILPAIREWFFALI